jgi:hypothetical protein
VPIEVVSQALARLPVSDHEAVLTALARRLPPKAAPGDHRLLAALNEALEQETSGMTDPQGACPEIRHASCRNLAAISAGRLDRASTEPTAAPGWQFRAWEASPSRRLEIAASESPEGLAKPCCCLGSRHFHYAELEAAPAPRGGLRRFRACRHEKLGGARLALPAGRPERDCVRAQSVGAGPTYVERDGAAAIGSKEGKRPRVSVVKFGVFPC